MNVKGAVKAHRTHSKKLIRGSEQELTLLLPVARVSSNVNPLFGDPTRETDDSGSTIGPLKCLWYDALSAKSQSATGSGFEQSIQNLAGQYRDATAFAELWLEDVLTDPDDANSKTWFDEAKEIIYLGKKFQVLAEIRLGLATTAPYILMIVLKGGAGYDAT